MAPFLLADLFGKWGAYAIFLAIGFGFGYALELAGFGNSRKLAAQFYFTDLTVLKVMFTAIITAMVLIFSMTALGLLDYNLLWVNPTYLWSGIVGGLIMGVGFVVGGFCPGTSLVAAATAKLDGIFFIGGVLFGIFLFGETVGLYDVWWNSSYMGRFTLMDWLGWNTGTVVLAVVVMALVFFWGGEKLEQYFGGKDPKAEPRLRYAGAGVLVLVAVGLVFMGQPTNEDRWERVAAEKETKLAERGVQVEIGELIATMKDSTLKVVLLDVRSEADYNQFHIRDARHIPLENLGGAIEELHMEPANTVFFVMSNDEAAATEAWKFLQAETVPNTYILEGGVNGWLAAFGDETVEAAATPTHSDDDLAYIFPAALGDRMSAARPHLTEINLEYTPKIELERKRAPTGGGCG